MFSDGGIAADEPYGETTPSPPSPIILDKGNEIRAVTGVTSILSIVGSLLIIFSFLLFKDTRTRARLILFHLSLTDLGVALANFIGDVADFDRFYYNGTTLDTDPPSLACGFCKAQAFFALFFTISSIFWTCILAVYMYFLTVEKGAAFMRYYLTVSVILCYSIPFGVSLWLVLTGRLGYSPYNSSGWCSLTLKKVPSLMSDADANQHDIYAAVFGYDLWIFTTIVLIIVVYLSTHLYIRQENAIRKISQKTGQTSIVSNVELKFLLIPVLFILLRIWSLINNIVFVYIGMDDNHVSHGVTKMLQCLAGIGDSGQGAVNGVIFVLFTRQVRNKLFQTCTCHRHEHNSGACCGYFEQCICLSHRSSRDEDDSVTVAKSGSFTSIDSSLNMEKKAEEIARKTKLLKGSDSSSCEKKCVYTPLSSYET